MRTPLAPSPWFPAPRFACRGFTLIELLTVIAIIGVLAAIIIPTVGRVRQTARNSTSLSNLKQIGQAMFLHAADNRNRLPLGADFNATDPSREVWSTAIASYLGTPDRWRPANQLGDNAALLRHPSDDLGDLRYRRTYVAVRGGTAGGAARGAFPTSANASAGRSLQDFVEPSRTLLVTEAPAANNLYFDRSGSVIDTPLVQINALALVGGGLNGSPRRANYLFADGSVRMMTVDETWGPAGTETAPNGMWTVAAGD